jgi:hypothetical protein
VQSAFEAIIEQGKIEAIANYFAPDYQQVSDGKTIDYGGFVAHIEALHSQQLSFKPFIFHEIIHEGNKIVTRHTSEITKPSGELLKAEVLAIFEVRDAKISRCWELSHIIGGNSQDQQLASML